MQTVTVKVSTPYAVHIGAGLLAHIGELIAAVTNARSCALVTDENVAPLYAETVREALAGAGFRVSLHVLRAGEEHKTLDTCGELLSFFASSGLTRTDFAVALGGGVVGDMTGFASAIYQRGIDFVQIPTTLLAACDASVGGKTAVDLPEGKNLAGAFHQPRLVVCDTDTFRTLPEAVFAEGMAEVIKHALIADRALFDALLDRSALSDMARLVRRNVEIKAEIVAQDEREHGLRKLLNFGHTLGHAIEACSEYRISHGEAVAAGMALISRAAQTLGYSREGTAQAVCAILERFGLPSGTGFDAATLFHAATADKKRSGSTIDIVILAEVGKAQTLRLSLAQLREWMEVVL